MNSLPVMIGLGVLIAIQLTLQVIAIVDLIKRPADALTLPKWAWALIIVLGEILGAVGYLVAGRKPVAAVEVAPTATASSRAEAAADALYGSAEDESQR